MAQLIETCSSCGKDMVVAEAVNLKEIAANRSVYLTCIRTMSPDNHKGLRVNTDITISDLVRDQSTVKIYCGLDCAIKAFRAYLVASGVTERVMGKG